MQEYPCGLCGRDTFLPVCREVDKFGQPIALAVCSGCGTRQLNPRATEDEQRQYYRRQYYDLYQRSEKQHLPAWAAKKRSIAAAMLDSLEAQTPLANRRLLDIGCGHGFLLEDAAARGARVFGVEPDEDSARALCDKGLPVFAGALDRFVAANLDHFDVVTLCHVLEHVSWPVHVLRGLRSLMTEDGLLCVEVPNARRPTRRGRPGLLPHGAHLYYFSETSLRAVFQRSGFRVLAAARGRKGRDVRLVGCPGPVRPLGELSLEHPETARRETRVALGMESPTLRERLSQWFA